MRVIRQSDDNEGRSNQAMNSKTNVQLSVGPVERFLGIISVKLI